MKHIQAIVVLLSISLSLVTGCVAFADLDAIGDGSEQSSFESPDVGFESDVPNVQDADVDTQGVPDVATPDVVDETDADSGRVDSDEPDVVEEQEPVIFEGTMIIEDSLDLQAVQDVTVVTGHLIIRNTGLTVITLPNLERVVGQLSIVQNFSLLDLSLPKLEYADNLYIQQNTNSTLDLRSLSRVATIVNIKANVNLPACLEPILEAQVDAETFDWGLDQTPQYPNRQGCTCTDNGQGWYDATCN